MTETEYLRQREQEVRRRLGQDVRALEGTLLRAAGVSGAVRRHPLAGITGGVAGGMLSAVLLRRVGMRRIGAWLTGSLLFAWRTLGPSLLKKPGGP